MLFYAARIVREPAMENPTIVVLTDRNDLDDQLYGQFQRCQELLGQAPVQAPYRDSLRQLLKVSSGGVVFTTIQKFLPESKGAKMPALSPRRNIVVIADEAHRTQYDIIDGFARHMRDAPCLHTMYVDKPMQGHGLMQAIARVNRVFRDKPGGLIVDYLGLADQLKHALATYTESGGKGNTTLDTARAIAAMLEKFEVAKSMLHGFDWSAWHTGTPTQRLALLPAAQEHILNLEDGKKRFVKIIVDLSKMFALCAASDQAAKIRDDIAFLQAVQAALAKRSAANGRSPEDIDAAVRQLVAKAIVANDGISDVFTAAGLKRPDISILDARFLADVRGRKHKNVAAELLERLLKDEIAARSRKNVVQVQLFSEKLKQTLNMYHNRAIATQEIIEELIKIAQDLRIAHRPCRSESVVREVLKSRPNRPPPNRTPLRRLDLTASPPRQIQSSRALQVHPKIGASEAMRP
jgi:type I site-specific restriction-modification system R (restriction) subunit